MKGLNDVFNVEEIPLQPDNIVTSSGEVIVPEQTSSECVDTDYNTARANLYQLLSQGQEALMHALDVAKQSESPRAFEVVGKLVEQLAKTNQQLLELSEKRKTILEPSKNNPAGQPANVTNNAIFVGSTDELNKMIKQLSRGE